jgi:hypothetical protein
MDDHATARVWTRRALLGVTLMLGLSNLGFWVNQYWRHEHALAFQLRMTPSGPCAPESGLRCRRGPGSISLCMTIPPRNHRPRPGAAGAASGTSTFEVTR